MISTAEFRREKINFESRARTSDEGRQMCGRESSMTFCNIAACSKGLLQGMCLYLRRIDNGTCGSVGGVDISEWRPFAEVLGTGHWILLEDNPIIHEVVYILKQYIRSCISFPVMSVSV